MVDQDGEEYECKRTKERGFTLVSPSERESEKLVSSVIPERDAVVRKRATKANQAARCEAARRGKKNLEPAYHI